MKKPTIWANTIINNEDQFIWFSIMSVINYVDKVLIYDSGSTDKTVEIINDLQKKYPNKIIFKEVGKVDKFKFSEMRQKMLDESKSVWIIILDGDEVWFEESIKKVIETIKEDKLDAIVVPFYNLVGDIYHFQEERAGEYNILGRSGHLTMRAINKTIPGLHIENPYGSEGYFDESNNPIQESKNRKLIFINAPFLHFTHLKRSSIGKQSKYKYELGKSFPKNFQFPKVFYIPRPTFIPSPWVKRSSLFNLLSILRYPLTYIWRRVK